MMEYVNINKWRRLASYLIDASIIFAVCLLLEQWIGKPSIQSVSQQILLVHGTDDIGQKTVLTQELVHILTTYLQGYILVFTMYEFLGYAIWKKTIGKAICHLEMQFASDKRARQLLAILVRCIVKAVVFLLFSGVIFIFSGFSILASPIQLSIQDRIAKTRIVSHKSR